jgi:hypothetical protein
MSSIGVSQNATPMRQQRHKNTGSIADVIHYTATPEYNNFREDSRIRAGEAQMIFAATKSKIIKY